MFPYAEPAVKCDDESKLDAVRLKTVVLARKRRGLGARMQHLHVRTKMCILPPLAPTSPPLCGTNY